MHHLTQLATLATFTTIALLAVPAGAAPIHPPQASAHGATLAEWMERQAVWEAGIPVVDGSHPGLDVGDVDCSVGQQGAVWFLEFPPTVAADLERRCAVPAGTTLYVPVLQWSCPHGISGFDQVADCLAQADGIFAVLELGLTVDGRSLDNEELQAYRARTRLFQLALVADSYWHWVCGCDAGASLDFAGDGIGALVGPLSVGSHEIAITYRSEVFGFAGSLTYRIQVTPRHTP